MKDSGKLRLSCSALGFMSFNLFCKHRWAIAIVVLQLLAALAPAMGSCRRESALLLLQVKKKVSSASNHREQLLSNGVPMVDTELIVLLSVGGMFVFGLILLFVFWSAKDSQGKCEAENAWPAARLGSPYGDHNPWPKGARGQTPVNMEQAPLPTMPLSPHIEQPHGPPTLAQLTATETQLGSVLGPVLLNGRSQAKQVCGATDPMQTQFSQMLSTGNRHACRPC